MRAQIVAALRRGDHASLSHLLHATAVLPDLGWPDQAITTRDGLCLLPAQPPLPGVTPKEAEVVLTALKAKAQGRRSLVLLAAIAENPVAPAVVSGLRPRGDAIASPPCQAAVPARGCVPPWLGWPHRRLCSAQSITPRALGPLPVLGSLSAGHACSRGRLRNEERRAPLPGPSALCPRSWG
jgi:hypothetical protein